MKPQPLMTDTQLQQLVQSMYRVWSTIAYDAMPCSRDVAIELCLDANRLSDLGRDRESDALVGAICAKPGGYARLCKLVRPKFNP